MGECDQPVVGMKSCFEHSEEDDMMKEQWSARECFMVRKAEVHLSEDNVLIPQVKMGVEARVQIRGAYGLEDAPITRASHPMAKYAESFTKNFDLIAERKSVVYHLRELAKASVIAKFLIDAEIQVEESWFNLAGEVEEACALEIPHLWNERAHSKIHVRDGGIVGAGCTRLHGVYGGVQFGLDKFDISRVAPRRRLVVSGPSVESQAELRAAAVTWPKEPGRARAVAPLTSAISTQSLAGLISPVSQAATPLVAAVPLSRMLPAARPGLPSLAVAPMMTGLSPEILAGVVPPLSAGRMAAIPRLGAAGTLAATAAPRGVDLNLSQFSLDTPQQVVEGNWVCEPQSADACKPLVDAFWSCVDDGKGCAGEEEDLHLLKNIFNPHLSDRRAEGEGFTPPDTSLTYINKLRSLVKEEENVRLQRINHFLSTTFLEDKPGPLFPLSWTESLEISRPKVAKKRGGTLRPRTNYSAAAEQVLKSGSPVFEKETEDGMTFRIYRMGSLEVRTTQPHNGEENVGVIFSVSEKSESPPDHTQTGPEKIVKVTEYVEKVPAEFQDYRKPDFKYYVVLETERGGTIVTEQLGETVAWEENVEDLEDRNSLAKVVRTASCREEGVRVQDLRRAKRPLHRLRGGSCRRSQAYATSVYAYAVGGAQGVLKAAESTEKEWDAQKDVDAEDEELEQRLAEEVAAVGEARLRPCGQCAEPLATGYKGAGGLWLCNACWQKARQKESERKWEDGW